MLKKGILSIFFLLTCSHAFSSVLDSLRVRLARTKNDSAKIELLYKASANKKLTSTSSDSLLNEILNFRNSKDCFIRSFCYYKVGSFHAQKESPQKALDHLIVALRVADSCNDKTAIMYVRYKMAYVNKINENFKVAINHCHISLKYARQLQDPTVLWENYTLLGNMYKTDLLLDSALFYHENALTISETKLDLQHTALTYNNLGLTYKNKKEFDKALSFLRKSLALKIKVKDKTLGSSYNNISIVFKHMGQFDSAVFYSNRVLDEGIRTRNGKTFKEGLSQLAEVYDAKKNTVLALHYYKRLRAAEDSIGKEELTSEYKELQSKYESDKKDAELKQKENNLKIAEAENSKKNGFILFSGIALLMAIIAAIVIFRSYRVSKRTGVVLSHKNKVIEEKNKEITDSINYARNIQQSLLTSEQVFSSNLKDHFILYKPKDIVSGDFFWASSVPATTGTTAAAGQKEFMIMCADCTGHGVPGAFMSLLGITFLKETISYKQITRPDLILNELRTQLIDNFSLSNNKDGMDAALIKIKGKHLEMAAANNPVWIIRDKTNIVLKPNKFPVGKHHGEIQPFSLNSFELAENDLIIMFTDGYADQFGGPKNKKYKYKRLETLILEKSHLPLAELKQHLEKEMEDWKGKNEQIDDILVLGVRI